MTTWTQQLRSSTPLTRHFAVVVVDMTGNELEHIPITAQTYTALRRILHDSPDIVRVSHTPGIGYEDGVQLLALKRDARQFLQQAEKQRGQLTQNVKYVQNTPYISLSQGDEYVSRARTCLRALEVLEIVQQHIQQVGPPLFQVMVQEVVHWVSKLRAAVTEADLLLAELPVPQPATDAGSVSSATEKTFLSGFDEEELVQVPYGLRFPDFPLRKQLKPLNASYLRLLEGFHLLVQGSEWERGLYERFEVMELETVPQKAGEMTKGEVMYLYFLSRYYTGSRTIDDAFVEHLRTCLSVRFMKHELLRHLADL
ncbi:hypothetical protein [Hymenobacter sp. YC55]|uniref:hypothetical protein n=1 Tax=Hymenobacter sp. YC55 TaxID=3034019 RepID=UPI0023F668AA|nr:hypothetical protein [Hymenobacter sp. YC55]MDF7812866.1 hypothetical protein [Hymenobacter sp. YC55]